jgi:hypothetical protein
MTADCYRGYSSPHKPTELTRGLVKNLYALGIPIEKIAKRLNIDADTLGKHYRAELDEGLQDMNTVVMNMMYKKITEKEDINAAYKWLKCRAGWKEASNEDENKNDVANYLLDQLRKKDINAE